MSDHPVLGVSVSWLFNLLRMKQTRSLIGQVLGLSIFALAIVSLLSVSSCRHKMPTDPIDTNYAPPPPPPPPPVTPGPPTSLPSAGIIGIRPVMSSANTGDFELDVMVADSSGNTIMNLPANAIAIPSGIDTVFGQQNTFSQVSISSAIQNLLGPYSVSILLDQSGSVKHTDPFNLRLLAAKLLLEGTALLPVQNEVQIVTFQDSTRDPNGYWQSYGSLSHNILPLLPIVDGLKNSIAGGTPLYDAMYNCIDTLATTGSNSNKALLVFTDGEDNESYMYPPYATLWTAIRHAKDNNVKVFGVVLQVGIDTALISAATATGGGIMHTDDAKQMVSYYRAMPNVLQGKAGYYKTKWHVQLPAGYSLKGRSISGNMKIKLPDNTQVAAPFSVTFP